MYIWIEVGLLPKLDTCWRDAPNTEPAEANRPATVIPNLMLAMELLILYATQWSNSIVFIVVMMILISSGLYYSSSLYILVKAFLLSLLAGGECRLPLWGPTKLGLLGLDMCSTPARISVAGVVATYFQLELVSSTPRCPFQA